MQELQVRLLLVHGLNQQLTEHLDELVVESQAQVVPFDSTLYLRHRQVGQITVAILPTSADEVGIVIAVATSNFGVDEAAGPAFVIASLAEQHALEVVEVHSVPLPAGAACCQHFLYAVEQRLANNWLVPPRQQLALVGEHAEVVRVLQHGVQLAIRDRLLAPLGTRPGGQAQVGHRVGQTFQGEVARGVQLECLPHQRRAYRVDDDAVDEAALVLDPSVLVANRRPAERPAPAYLVLHLDPDIFTAHPDLDFVHDVGDTLHGVGPNALAEVFLRRYELHAQRCELAFSDTGIDVVAERSGAHVDDHEIDLAGMLADELQQLPKDGPLLNGLRGGPRLQVLAPNIDAEGRCLTGYQLALGGNRVAVGIDVSGRIQLPLGRYPEVGQRPPAGV